MTARIEYEVTSDQAGQIPAIGTFEPGDTIRLTDMMLAQFEATYGCKVGAANFPAHTHLTVYLIDDKEEEAKV